MIEDIGGIERGWGEKRKRSKLGWGAWTENFGARSGLSYLPNARRVETVSSRVHTIF